MTLSHVAFAFTGWTSRTQFEETWATLLGVLVTQPLAMEQEESPPEVRFCAGPCVHRLAHVATCDSFVVAEEGCMVIFPVLHYFYESPDRIWADVPEQEQASLRLGILRGPHGWGGPNGSPSGPGRVPQGLTPVCGLSQHGRCFVEVCAGACVPLSRLLYRGVAGLLGVSPV